MTIAAAAHLLRVGDRLITRPADRAGRARVLVVVRVLDGDRFEARRVSWIEGLYVRALEWLRKVWRDLKGGVRRCLTSFYGGSFSLVSPASSSS